MGYVVTDRVEYYVCSDEISLQLTNQLERAVPIDAPPLNQKLGCTLFLQDLVEHVNNGLGKAKMNANYLSDEWKPTATGIGVGKSGPFFDSADLPSGNAEFVGLFHVKMMWSLALTRFGRLFFPL